jgi:Calcineurin-like phosphoesterase
MERMGKQQLPVGLIGPLMEGPLDIVGDVHGEIDALRDLFGVLGYDAKGRHSEGRRLVFVGDICDRGPDSVAVMELVGELVDRQLAQCVLGNHELNILLASRKEGNGWYFDGDHDRQEGKFDTSRPADSASRGWIDTFIASLPIALHGPGLRVVHACWHNDAVRTIASATQQDVLSLYSQFDRQSAEDLQRDGTLARAEQEQRQHHKALHDPESTMAFLPALARKNQVHQMANPIRILTSGVERQTTTPFFSSGKWRMVERVAWWDEYQDETPVVMGHYWRWPVPVDRQVFGKAGVDLFAGTTVEQGLGPRANVYCVDYSVGRRFQERLRGGPFLTRLAALRWPERSIAFDDGSILPIR